MDPHIHLLSFDNSFSSDSGQDISPDSTKHSAIVFGMIFPTYLHKIRREETVKWKV